MAAVLAFVAIFALRARAAWAPLAVWVFDIEGSLDLAYALAQGVASRAAPGMGAAFWIPAVLVPALLVSHALVFWLLARRRTFETVLSRPAAA